MRRRCVIREPCPATCGYVWDESVPPGTASSFGVEVSEDGKISYDLAGAVDLEQDLGNGKDLPDNGTPVLTPDDLSDEGEWSDKDEGEPGSGIPIAAEQIDTNALGQCDDSEYNLYDRKEYGTYKWHIGDGSMPAGVSRAAASVLYESGINRIVNSTDGCGYSDLVSATAEYEGYTSYESDIDSAGRCAGRDLKSTWDASSLAVTGAIAVTCAWTRVISGAPNDLVEADVRFDTQEFNFTSNASTSCSGKHDVVNAATHEAGHLFGLAHVSGSAHTNLTMYSNAGYCEIKKRTLGRGDVLGLRARY